MFDTLFYAELISKIVLTTALIIGGSLFLRKSFNIMKSEEVSFQKYFSLGIALFGYCYAATRIFFIFSDFLTEGNPDYLLFWRLAAISTLIALVFLEIIIETYLVKTYYFFSIVAITGAILMAIVDLNIARIISFVYIPILLINVIGMYIYVAYKSQGKTREKAIFTMLGILLLVIGIVVDGTFFKNLVGFDTGLFGAIIMLVGFTLFFKVNY